MAIGYNAASMKETAGGAGAMMGLLAASIIIKKPSLSLFTAAAVMGGDSFMSVIVGQGHNNVILIVKLFPMLFVMIGFETQ